MNAPELNSTTEANSPRIITPENKVTVADDIDRLDLKNLVVIYRRIDDLIPYARNSRTHNRKQLRKLAKCIKRFGFINPVVIDANDVIICGHARVLAAKQAGIDKVPTIRLEHLSPEEIRVFVIADNKLAEAGWDEAILKIELQNIIVEGVVDVGITGFEIPEIDIKLGASAEEDPADEIPTEQSAAVSRPGDLWILDGHQILCADSQDEAAVKKLMGERLAEMVFTDPPYNVKIDGNASGKGIVKHPDFAMACGELTQQEFTAFLERTLGALAKCSIASSLHYIAMDFRHMRELLAAGDKIFDSLLNVCVWDKGSGGQGSFYRSQHELFFVFRKGKGPHRNNIQLGRFGRYRTNCWHYPGVRGLSQLQGEEGNLLALHPTVKPVALIADAILDCTAPGDLVLDGFLGSGSTVIAAERVRRTCYGLEISPHYVDVAIRRWQRYRGAHAVLAATGQTFEERAALEVGVADDPKKSKVGYKKPPKEKQFSKGVSGNPRGRPKRCETLNSLMREVGEKPVSMTEGDRTKVITLKKAIVNQLGNGAARGDYRYLALYMKLATQLESAEQANGTTQELDELDAATLRGAVRRLRSVDIDSLLDPDQPQSEIDPPEFDSEVNETSDAADTEPPTTEED